MTMKKNPDQTGKGVTINRASSLLLFLMTIATLFAASAFLASCGEDEEERPGAKPLSVISIAPATGGAGTEVTIMGTGFNYKDAENTVTINNKPCAIVSAVATQIKVIIPEDAGSGPIKVTVGGVTAESPTTFAFIEEIVLGIISIAPTSGPKATVVTITGTGFSTTAANNVVTLNGKSVTVNSATETQLSVVIPPAAGSGPLRVTVDGETVQSSNFEYLYTTSVGTLAGSTSGYTDATGTAAKFNQPYGGDTDAAGNVYIADASNHKIRKITPAGVVTTLAGSTGGDAIGTGAAAQFNYPYDVAVDGSGNVYVVDTHNHKIKKVTPAGEVTLLAGSTGGYADGTGAAAQFYYPTGAATDAAGNVYVAEKDSHKIRKITPAGVVTTLAGSSNGYADGTGTAALFSSPMNLTVDPDGNVYVVDHGNHKIRKITPGGVVTTFAGSTEGDTDGTGTAAKFRYPYSIDIDPSGNLWVIDTHNHKLKKITPNGVVTTVAGTTSGYVDGGVATAKFNYPTDVMIDVNGKIYIAEKDNHVVRMLIID